MYDYTAEPLYLGVLSVHYLEKEEHYIYISL